MGDAAIPIAGVDPLMGTLQLVAQTIASRAFWWDWVWGVTINGFCTSLVLPLVLLLIVGLLFLDWGRGMGIPYLLRPEGPEGRPAPGRQFLVGVGAGLLIWQVFLAGYLAEEFATSYTADHAPFCEVRDPLSARALEDVDGFPGRFRYRPDDVGSIWRYAGTVTASMVALAVVGYPIFYVLIQAWILAVSLGQRIGAGLRGDGPAPEAGVPRHEVPRKGLRWRYPLSSWVALLAGMVVSAGLITVAAPWLMRGPGRPWTGWIGGGLVWAGGYGEADARNDQLDAVVRAKRARGSRESAAAAAPPAPELGELARRPGGDGGPVPYARFQRAQRELDAVRERAVDLPDRDDLRKVADHARTRVRKGLAPYEPVFGLFVVIVAATSLFFAAATGLEALLGRFAPESGPRRWVAISPAGWIVFLLQMPVCWVTLMSYFSPWGLQFSNLILLCMVVFVGGHRYYKLRFPNLEAPDYRPYVSPVRLQEEAYPAMNAAAAAGQASGLLRSEDVPYTRQEGGATLKPPMALVCVSGGGSRSAFWTMNVLAELERAFEGEGVAFPYHVRLVTGASGGMLAGAAYVASLEEPGRGSGPHGPLPRGVNRRTAREAGPGDTPLERLIAATGDDFLHDVARQLGWRDLRSILSPNLVAKDRGWAIEEAWRRSYAGILDRTFEDLREGEERGWRPSLIFSPMLVEDGRQLFLSNLDLRRVTEDRSRVLHPQDPLPPTDVPEVLSREGVEFFKLFPPAWSTFQVGTAARMSASFPYVLPAAVLPTDPPRRVVDAGYYDNYGVGIAMSWLSNHLPWVRDNTSGVVLIQIRDGASEKSRRRWEVPDAPPGLVGRGLQWATTPPQGIWQFRQASQVFRNDNLIDVTTKLMRASGFPDGFFATAIFEFNRGDDVSLSWKLIKHERDLVRAVFAPDDRAGGAAETRADAAIVAEHREDIRERRDAVLQWWRDRLASPEARA